VYRIGQFSNISKVTVKALRFYEEEGLLEPKFVDPVNGFRYYGSEQLPLIHKIVSLKQCGFSLPEIRLALNGKGVAELFAGRRKSLEAALAETSAQLAAVDFYLSSIKERGMPSHQVIMKGLPRVMAFSRRMKVESYDSYYLEIPGIGEEVAAANPGMRCLTDPPYCFIEYHDGEYKERDIDVEFFEAVHERGVDTPTIKFKEVPAVPEAACVLHKGPYSALREAYMVVFRWIEDNGYAPAGNPRESYIDGIWNRGDPADWLTEVQVPVRRLEA
jgi:DNA-binding transcriptional MerR regulator/effector-binding domain-containing protein